MGIRYFALVPLTVWTGGERHEFVPGDILPEDAYQPGHTVTMAAIHADEIAPVPAALADLVGKPKQAKRQPVAA